MRFTIHLRTTDKKKFLPIDYQYAMASAIYKLIARGDEAYSRFLHDEGFSPGGLRRFKLFTFSQLSLPRYTTWKDRNIFELHGDALSFTVSFMADKAAEVFIKGMFMDQRLDIGDYFNTLRMEVASVEALPAPYFTPTMHYRCVSPMCVEWKEGSDGYEQYLQPDDPQFEGTLLRNLIAKCAAFNMLHNDATFPEDALRFSLAGNYKSKLITLKPGTRQQTKVRGFLFDFALTAPEYMHEMGYYAGFGMNNAMGFGGVTAKESAL